MSDIDRRQHPRLPVTYAVEIDTMSAEGLKITTTGNLQDISDSGISFVIRNNSPLQLGQKVEISILTGTEASTERTLHAKGEIMRIEYNMVEFDQTVIGLRLEDLIESDILT